MAPFLKNAPVRVVLQWQIGVTTAMALFATIWWGFHGAASALLGGVVNISAGVVFAWMTSRSKVDFAADTIRTMIRAEVVKIALIAGQLWLMLTTYRDIVPLVFFAAFAITVLLTRMAFFDQDT